MGKETIDKATIIILNWNGKPLLRQNLSFVFGQTYRNYEVLVVDNGSSDGSEKYIKNLQKKEKKLKFINTGENLGYAGGNNVGIERILKEGKSKYVVILNNDVKVEEDWLEKLLAGFNDPEIGICTSKILLYYPYLPIAVVPQADVLLEKVCVNKLAYHSLIFPNGFAKRGQLLEFPKKLKGNEIYYIAAPYRSSRKYELELAFKGTGLKIFNGDRKFIMKKSGCRPVTAGGQYVIQNAGSLFDKKRLLFEDRLIFEFDRPLITQLVDAGCGASMAIRCDLLKNLGAFVTKYFMYWEDSELSYRYNKTGFKTRFIQDAVCYHWFWGSSNGKVTNVQTFYGTRNRLWFIRKYFGLFSFFYYYLRTVARTIIWGFKSFYRKDARMFLISNLRVLKKVFASNE